MYTFHFLLNLIRPVPVERSSLFIAIKPFASRYEWEVHILPLDHQHDYTSIGAEALQDLGRILRRVMARLDRVLGGVQYKFFPQTTIPNGFELDLVW